jgi:hypothetical protein
MRSRRRGRPQAITPVAEPTDADTRERPAERADDSAGGYALVRILGIGSRSTVHLGRAAREVRHGDSVAVKVIGSAVSDESVDAEVAALCAHGSHHVVRLIDLSIVGPRARCLILERLGGSLDELLAHRSRIRVGEAVTVLASVARGVHDLHLAGWSHRKLSAREILFDPSGRPVIVGLGSATRLGTGRRTVQEEAREDWTAFRHLVKQMFERVDLEGREAAELALLEALDAVVEPGASIGIVGRIEDAIFAIAPAAPVVFATSTNLLEGRSGRAEREFDELVSPGGADRQSAQARWPVRPRSATQSASSRPGRRARLETAAIELLDRPVSNLVRERVLSGFSRHRRPLIVAGAAGLVVLTLSLALVPSDDDQPHAATRSAVPASPTAGTSTGSAAAGEPTPSTTEPSNSAVTQDDDSVGATQNLIEERQRCLELLVLSCVEKVDQPGSALLEADRSAIARAHSDKGSERPLDYTKHAVSLIERTGNSALLDLVPSRDSPADSKPASALAIKGEAGWRLREIFSA